MKEPRYDVYVWKFFVVRYEPHKFLPKNAEFLSNEIQCRPKDENEMIDTKSRVGKQGQFWIEITAFMMKVVLETDIWWLIAQENSSDFIQDKRTTTGKN